MFTPTLVGGARPQGEWFGNRRSICIVLGFRMNVENCRSDFAGAEIHCGDFSCFNLAAEGEDDVQAFHRVGKDQGLTGKVPQKSMERLIRIVVDGKTAKGVQVRAWQSHWIVVEKSPMQIEDQEPHRPGRVREYRIFQSEERVHMKGYGKAAINQRSQMFTELSMVVTCERSGK